MAVLIDYNCGLAPTLVFVNACQVDVCVIEEPQKEPDELPEPPPYPAHSDEQQTPCSVIAARPTQWGFQHRPP